MFNEVRLDKEVLLLCCCSRPLNTEQFDWAYPAIDLMATLAAVHGTEHPLQLHLNVARGKNSQPSSLEIQNNSINTKNNANLIISTKASGKVVNNNAQQAAPEDQKEEVKSPEDPTISSDKELVLTSVNLLLHSRLYNWRQATGALPSIFKFNRVIQEENIEEIAGQIEFLAEVVATQREKYNHLTKQHVKPRAIDPAIVKDFVTTEFPEYHTRLNIFNIIRLDLTRTFNEFAYFNLNHDNDNESVANPTVVHLLDRILSIYAIEHNGEEGYKQGYNEIAAMLLIAIEYDYIIYRRILATIAEYNVQHNKQNKVCLAIQQIFDSNYLEADLYTLFCYIMQILQPYYQSASIQSKLNYIQNQLLQQIDPQLHSALQTAQILPTVYMMRWLRLLFIRELSINQLLYVWDYILNSSSEKIEMIDFLVVALLLTKRNQILQEESDFMLQIVMKTDPSTIEIESVCYMAETLLTAVKTLHNNAIDLSCVTTSGNSGENNGNAGELSPNSGKGENNAPNSTKITLNKLSRGVLAVLKQAAQRFNQSTDANDIEIADWTPQLKVEYNLIANSGGIIPDSSNSSGRARSAVDSNKKPYLRLSEEEKSLVKRLGIDWKSHLNANNTNIFPSSHQISHKLSGNAGNNHANAQIAEENRLSFICSGYLRKKSNNKSAKGSNFTAIHSASSSSGSSKFQTRYIHLQDTLLTFGQRRLNLTEYKLSLDNSDSKQNRFSLQAKAEYGFASVYAPLSPLTNSLFEMQSVISNTASNTSNNSSELSAVATTASYSVESNNYITVVPQPPRPPPIQLLLQAKDRLSYLLWVGAIAQIST
jgi:hypothetical protein